MNAYNQSAYGKMVGVRNFNTYETRNRTDNIYLSLPSWARNSCMVVDGHDIEVRTYASRTIVFSLDYKVIQTSYS